MLFVYGIRNKALGQQPLEGACSSCGQESRVAVVFQNYAHLFFIPLFPTTKKAIVFCAHCQKVTPEKEVRADDRPGLHGIRQSFRTPKYLFAGALLFAGLVGYAQVSVSGELKTAQAYLANPRSGDLFVFEMPGEGKPRYGITRVESIAEDGRAVVSMGRYVYTALSPAKKVLKSDEVLGEGYFAEDKYIMAVQQLNSRLRGARRIWTDS